ncbi:MAG: hypothetical protein WCL22_01670, partial [bacterium]
MKNTPSASPKKTPTAASATDARKHMRVNAIWLMNAAAFTVTVAGAVKTSVFDVKATDYYWAGNGTLNLAGVTTGTQQTGNWWAGSSAATGAYANTANQTYSYTQATASATAVTVTIYGDQIAANVDQSTKAGAWRSDNNNLFFGSVSATAKAQITSSGNVAAQGLRFVSGASAYT